MAVLTGLWVTLASRPWGVRLRLVGGLIQTRGRDEIRKFRGGWLFGGAFSLRSWVGAIANATKGLRQLDFIIGYSVLVWNKGGLRISGCRFA